MAVGNLVDPFQLFPKEVWEIICDQMEDSKDILSLLHSFPKLDVSIDKQKRIWLIGQVLPFLVEYIDWESVSNLRLVCKQWQRRVDSFLQNQPLYRAYSHELHQDYFNFWNFLNPLESNGFESHLILKRETANSLISTILSQRLQSLRNPFIFRKLQFQFENELNSSRLNEGFLNKIFELLERFGSHLWYVEINAVYSPQILEVINLPGGILQTIVRILEHTPNLKSLILTGFKQDLELTSPGYPPISERMFPKLPYLETFKLTGDTDVFSDEFIQTLVNCYGPQIRRLEMPLNRWKMEEFQNLFPALTELELEDCDEDISKLIDILMTLSSPNLAALTLPFGDSKPIYLKISDILQRLQRFPKIKYLSICPQNQSESKITLEEKEIVDSKKFLIPSLQSLRIMDGLDLSYNFLNCFPSLKNLEILFGFKPVVVDLSMPDSVVKIREHIQTGKMYHSNIWKLLRKLRSVTLTAHLDDYDDYEWQFKFNRDTYEKLEKIGISLNNPVQHPLRRDVWDFIRSSVGEDVLFNLNDIDDENSSESSCSADVTLFERVGSNDDESTSDDDE